MLLFDFLSFLLISSSNFTFLYSLSGGLPITPYTEIGEDGRIILHPVAVVIGNRPENSDVINIGCIDSRLEGYEKGSLITVEQLVKDGKVNDINNPIPNWSKSWSLDHNFGDQSFTVYGSSTYNIKGSYTELIRKKDRELGKEAGTNPFGLKIMLDSLGLRLKGGLTISVSTKWFKLKKFEMYGTIGYGLNIKAVGLAGRKDWYQPPFRRCNMVRAEPCSRSCPT